MKRVMLLTAVVVLIVTAGCSSSTDTLVVYSGRSEELVQPIIDRFEEKYGYEVDVRYAGSTDLAATLLQEGESSEADVFYAQDPASLGSVTSLMAVLDDEILDRVEPRFADGEGRWVGTSGRVRTFIYNTSTENELPQTIDDVNEPIWAGQLGVAPTNGSFLAFVSAMILERGEGATLEWLQELAANQPQEFPSNAPIVDAADAGTIQGGLVNHYYLLRLRAEGAGNDSENWFIPAGDAGTLVMTAGAGQLASSDNPEGAALFIEYLLSTEGQTYFAEETFEYPLVDEVPPAPGLPPLDEINSPDIDLSQLADVLDDATRLVTEAGLV